jgi:hypothetical protein
MRCDISPKEQPHMSHQNYLTALRFLSLPVIVFVLASLIFEFVAFDIGELIIAVRNAMGQGDSVVRAFQEAQARLLWGTTVFIFYPTFIAVIIFNFRMFRKSLTARYQMILAAVIVVIVLLFLGHFIYSAQVRNNFSNIFFFTFETLMASNLYTSIQMLSIKSLVSGINILAVLVPTIVVITGCCVLIQESSSSMSELKLLEAQMGRLKMIISSASMLIVAGVLHMIAWLRWPSVLIYDDQISRNVANFSDALGLYWGATFSLLLAVLYVPAALNIQQHARLIISENPDLIAGMDAHDWLKKHGLSVAPMQQIPQIAVMLAPLLAGPVGSTLTNLSSSFASG